MDEIKDVMKNLSCQIGPDIQQYFNISHPFVLRAYREIKLESLDFNTETRSVVIWQCVDEELDNIFLRKVDESGGKYISEHEVLSVGGAGDLEIIQQAVWKLHLEDEWFTEQDCVCQPYVENEVACECFDPTDCIIAKRNEDYNKVQGENF